MLAATVSSPLVLQFIGVDFVDESDAAAFLLLINQHAGLRFGDEAHGRMQLIAAIAALGGKHISGQALGVDSNESNARRG